jgi:hypothetical protein
MRMVGCVQEDLVPAFRQFADALVAFSEDPGPANLERYLVASRALEESRGFGQERSRHTNGGREHGRGRRRGFAVDWDASLGEG